MGDIYRHDINLKDKQSITMFSKRSTPYNKAELARLLYMQGYRDQTTGLRVNTSSTPVVLYNSTGSNTDGAMTQKATTDALSALAGSIPPPPILYGSTGNNTDGAMTQKATTDALLDLASGIPDISMTAVTGNIWTGYKLTINNKFVILVGTCTNTSTGSKTFNFGFSFKSTPFLSTGYTGATGPLGDGVGIGDISNRGIALYGFTYNQRYSNRGKINFIAVGEI